MFEPRGRSWCMETFQKKSGERLSAGLKAATEPPERSWNSTFNHFSCFSLIVFALQLQIVSTTADETN